ncbi:MAG: serine/threonine-protein kinase [Gemmatimonadales bacterium]
MPHPSAPPTIPGFAVVRRVSRAGDPVDVWEGRATGGATVAIKTLDADRGVPYVEHRFWNEAAVLGRVGGRHHVIELIARVASPAALVLEWAMGGTLRDRIHPGGFSHPANPLDLRTVLGLGIDLVEALAWIHGQGVFHRDLKPSNVLLDAGGRALLADFGIAASGVPPRSLPEGWEDDEVGTIGYAAPELLAQADTANSAVDLYGLGATLYEALTGRLAFDLGPDETDAGLRTRISGGERAIPIRLRGWRGPAAVSEVIDALLEPNPTARPGLDLVAGRLTSLAG